MQRAAEPHRALGHHVEHGLDVVRRAGDDAEHLAGRRQLRLGLGETLFELPIPDGSSL